METAILSTVLQNKNLARYISVNFKKLSFPMLKKAKLMKSLLLLIIRYVGGNLQTSQNIIYEQKTFLNQFHAILNSNVKKSMCSNLHLTLMV